MNSFKTTDLALNIRKNKANLMHSLCLSLWQFCLDLNSDAIKNNHKLSLLHKLIYTSQKKWCYIHVKKVCNKPCLFFSQFHICIIFNFERARVMFIRPFLRDGGFRFHLCILNPRFSNKSLIRVMRTILFYHRKLTSKLETQFF